MAYLNGTHIPNLLRFRTLLTKVVGAALAVPSGLAIGPEGPMVHIGACIASTITYANCAAVTWLRYVWPWPCNGLEEGDDDDSLPGDLPGAPVQKGVWCQTWEELHEDSEHREFISAGAAAGLSVRLPPSNSKWRCLETPLALQPLAQCWSSAQRARVLHGCGVLLWHWLPALEVAIRLCRCTLSHSPSTYGGTGTQGYLHMHFPITIATSW